jgi:hypothetical protein
MNFPYYDDEGGENTSLYKNEDQEYRVTLRGSFSKYNRIRDMISCT